YNSLSFEWEPVKGAIQYGYQLVTEEGLPVAADVIQATKIKISDLQDDTEYTLRVWPFAGVGVNYNTPAAVEITGRTAAIIKLGNPVVTVTMSGNTTKFSWAAVENAEKYTWELFKDSERIAGGSTANVEVSRRNLAEGEYVFTVQATTEKGGYSNGDVVTETFRIGEVEPDTWSVVGTYQCDKTGDYYDVTLTKNEDGTYTIEKFWGYAGYNLTFEVDDDGFAKLDVPPVEGYTNYAWLWASEDDPLWVYVKTGNEDYSPMFSGDKDSGEFWFGYYWYGGTDEEADEWWFDYLSWGDTGTRSSWSRPEKPAKQGPGR
ncbi:MAG: hypothetical protein K2G69_08185, partial [Muribaculaceae bacterium]|nr:hypothetical protein [Muribaculaceae bacterium]